MICVVYWLHDDSCADPRADGYVGITYYFERRVKRHRTSRRFPDGFSATVLFRGTRSECIEVEKQHRPKGGMGWNRCSGGYGGRVHAKSSREKISASLKGRQFSPEHRERLGAVNRGKPRPASSIGNSKRRLSAETRAKIGAWSREFQKGRKHSDATKEKMSAARAAWWREKANVGV